MGNHNLHLQNNNSNPFFSVLKTFMFPWHGLSGGFQKDRFGTQTTDRHRQPPSGAVLRCTDIKGEVETCYKILESNGSQRQFDGNRGWIEVMYIRVDLNVIYDLYVFRIIYICTYVGNYVYVMILFRAYR